MKKKSGNKNVENKLDFDDLEGLDGDMDFGDLENIDDSRSTSGNKPGAIAKELAEEAGKGFLDSVAKKTASKALPDSYSNNYYAAMEYGDFAKETFGANKSKINKSLYNLGKEVKKILPFQSKMLDGFLSKYETDFEQFKAQSEEQIREGSIQSNLASIFDKQLDIQKAFEAKRSSEAQVDKKQRLAIDKVNIDVLTSIDGNISNQTAFTLQISKEYYRKSLELQYKSYFIQSDMLKTMRDYYKGFSLQLENIAKYSALPDFVKLNTSERVSEVLRTQFIQNTYKQLFSSSDYIKNVKQKVSNLVSEKISGITDGIDQATDALGGLNQAGEFGGGGGRVLGSVLSGMGGGILGEKASKMIPAKYLDKIKNNKTIQTGGNILDMAANSPRTLFGMLKGKADKASDEYSDESTPLRFLAKKLFGGASELLGATQVENPDFQVKKASILDHNKPAIFDNKVHRSISEIIPMYLSKILNENVNLRQMYKTVNLGKLKNLDDKEELVYNYVDRKLSTKKDFQDSVKSSVFKDGDKKSKNTERVSSNINSLAISSSEKSGNKDDIKFLKNKNAQKSFSDFLSKAAEKIDTKDFNYDSVVTNIDKNPELSQLIEKGSNLEKYIEILKKNKLSKKHLNLNERVADTKRTYPITAVTELFKATAVLSGSKFKNKIKPDIADKLAEGFFKYLTTNKETITIPTITSGKAFREIDPKFIGDCLPAINIFVAQCKAIEQSGDTQKEMQLTAYIGTMVQEIYNNELADPALFQTFYDYSTDLQESGKLGAKNLVEGEFGVVDKYAEKIDPEILKQISKVQPSKIKELAKIKSKTSIFNQIQNSVFGGEMDKFIDIKKQFGKDLGAADNYKEIGSSVKKMYSAIVQQSQDSGKKLYKAATDEFSKAFDTVNTMIKDISETKIPLIKQTMLKSADKYIADVEDLIRKEQESKQIISAKLDEITKTLEENIDDQKTIKDMQKTLNRSLKLKDIEIQTLQKFKVNLQSSKNRIANINIETPIDVSKFVSEAKSAFNSLMTEAKETLAEVEAKTQAEAEAV